MFNFIFGRKNVFIGVDIGTSLIKMVELRVKEGKIILSNYAWTSLGENVLGKSESNSDSSREVIVECLKSMIRKADFSGSNAYLSLPAFGGLISLLDFTDVADVDIDEAVKAEAHKYIPTSLDEVVISWEIVGKSGEAGLEFDKEENSAGQKSAKKATTKVLLVAASRKKVFRYEELAKLAGLSLSSIDIETFSSIRSLIGNDPGSFILVDSGAGTTNLALVENGIIVINRNIDTGGIEITKTISKALGVDFERAEALKISDKNFFDKDTTISFFTLEKINDEIERLNNAYHKSSNGKNVSRIILTGGTAGMSGLAEYFSNKLGMDVSIGKPFSRINYDERLENNLDQLGNNFSVAVGLALKGADDYLKNTPIKN